MRLSRFLLGVFIFLVPQALLLQESPCSEPKVAVFLEEIHDEVFDHLIKKHPERLKEEWLPLIQECVLHELRQNSPGTQFIAALGKPSDGCDYYFSYILSLISAGEDKEIAGIKHSAYTSYWMISELGTNNQCGVQNRILEIEPTKDNPDIFQAIAQNVAAFGNIGGRIDEYEDSFPVPPRGPEFEVSVEPEKVSPLEEETKLDIKIQVKNCEGESVYGENSGQVVILPRKTERGEIKPTRGFPQGQMVTNNIVMLLIQKSAGASATYTLKKGIEPGEEQVKMMTCGLDKRAVMEAEINIRGLEIKVKPRNRIVRPGERTHIQLEFNKVDEAGNTEPVAAKTLALQIDGLNNGTVSPRDNIQTDQQGRAVLEYRSGSRDKRVTFKVEYQPKDIQETVKGQASVSVFRKAVWTGTVTYTRNYNKTRTQAGPGGATVKTQEIVTERAEIQIHGWPFSHTYDAVTGTDLYYEGDENSVTGFYSARYRKVTTVRREQGTSVTTDTARCQGTISDGGYLVINNEEMTAHLLIGASMDEQCTGQTTISGTGGSGTIDFDWDHHLSFAGDSSLDANIATKNPSSVSGSFSLPEYGITWTWNLTKTGK